MDTLMLWEVDDSLTPQDQEERFKQMMSNLESVKAAVDSGNLKMWGMSPGGGYGYAIAEADGKEMLAMCSQDMPQIKFKVKPMLSIDEVIDVMKGMQQ